MSSSVKHTKLVWSVVVAGLALASAGLQGIAAAETRQHHEQSGEQHTLSDEHTSEHHHGHHMAIFVGVTEAEEREGHKEDPQFTLGFDYERRLSKLFGLGAMFDWVAEGKREILIGPIGFIHPYKGLSVTAAPCYQRARKSGHEGFVFRVGGAWDFQMSKYTISPNLVYDLTKEEDFFVVGVCFGKGF